MIEILSEQKKEIRLQDSCIRMPVWQCCAVFDAETGEQNSFVELFRQTCASPWKSNLYA